MNASKTPWRSLRGGAIIGTAALAGIALGAGGASLALWSDGVTLSGEISSGYEHFAAGRAGDTAPATDGRAVASVDADDAATLLADGEIAIALQTDSISRGNKGLRYTVAEPDWGDGVFGRADVVLFPVPSAAACAVDATVPADPVLVSTPVSADYSDTETPVAEYWCLVATIGDLPDEGAYENEAVVTAEDPSGTSVTDRDSWHAEVTTAIDPDDEADHLIAFDYETFRPEVTP